MLYVLAQIVKYTWMCVSVCVCLCVGVCLSIESPLQNFGVDISAVQIYVSS